MNDDKLRKLAEAAITELREAIDNSGLYGNVPLGGEAITARAFTTEVACQDDRWGRVDARVIAAAVNAAPALLDRIAKAEAALSEESLAAALHPLVCGQEVPHGTQLGYCQSLAAALYEALTKP